MLTAFEYMYRDAGNFKAYGTVLLEGAVDAADKQLICGRLDSRELFIAEQVNVPALYEQLYQWSDGPTQSDHCWHEFIGFHEIASAPDAATVQAKEFIARFAAVDEWDETLSPHFRLADPLDPNRCRAFT